MADNTEVPLEVQPLSTSPSGRFEGLREFRFTEKELEFIESVRHAGRGESDDPLSLLVDVALAPPCGDRASCSCDWEDCGWQQGSLDALQLQLQVLLNKAHVLQSALVEGHGHNETEDHAATVRRFLFTCQPYFNLLESEARNTESGFTSLPFDVHTQYADFSQQLCDTLKQLVLTYASYNLLCLDESKPHSLSYFAIGQTFVGRLRLSTFVYCRPMPFLALVDTGLYKCMRWNVDRLGDETDEDTEYYFLCYEDVPSTDVEPDGDGLGASVVRMWSIGRWVQLTSNPNSHDIIDWILCKVPPAKYQKLLSLGSEEPSSWGATDLLLQLLWYTEGHWALQECVCLRDGAHDVCVESTDGASTDHRGQNPSSSS